MSKTKNKKNSSASSSQNDDDFELDHSSERAAASQDFDPGQLLDSAREFVEGHPGRATLIGAVIGGALGGLFASERGRQLVRAGYSYARPMIADYARNFVASNTDNAINKALPQ